MHIGKYDNIMINKNHILLKNIYKKWVSINGLKIVLIYKLHMAYGNMKGIKIKVLLQKEIK